MNTFDPDLPEGKGWLTKAQARRQLLDPLEPISGRESAALLDAPNRALDRDMVAPYEVSSHDNCAMGGDALRAADLTPDAPTRLAVVGATLSGIASSGSIGPGQAARVMTVADVAMLRDDVTAIHAAEVEIPPRQPARQKVRRAEFLRGVLRPMSEANGFIALTEDQGSVAAGDRVPVQVCAGLV